MSDAPFAYLDGLLPSWVAPYLKLAAQLGAPPEVSYPAAVFVVGIVVGASATIAVTKRRTGHEQAQTARQQRDAMILAVMAVREGLLGYGEVDAEKIEVKLANLEASEHSLWTDHPAWVARRDFLVRARAALKVRRVHNDYRNEIERGETNLMLGDAADRVTAALRNKAIPAPFNPFEDEQDPWFRRGWRRMKRLWRRSTRAFR